MKIRIFDDETRQREKFLRDIESAGLSSETFDVGVLVDREFKDAFDGMRERQTAFRESGAWEQDGRNPLDNVDVLMVDFDLFGTQGVTNADQVAYLARCFTTCGIIVVMNRFSHNPFDLTLKDYPASFSDLEIGQKQLGSRTLWGTGQEKFAPWYWPILPRSVKNFQQRIKDVEASLQDGQMIRSMLEFPEESWQWLPRNMLQFLGKDDRLDEFLRTSPFGLYPKDRDALGTTAKDVDAASVSRLLAARIFKWLEWLVLPEMDILVDAPHLVSRFPSLLKGDRSRIETWNAVAVRYTDEVSGMDTKVLAPFQLKKAYWLSRPAWFWRNVMTCDEIDDVREPWNIEAPPWLFCEDTSSFHPEEECYLFKAETVSPFASRYVKKLTDVVDYLPPQRFAL